jgi:hypothetical protein
MKWHTTIPEYMIVIMGNARLTDVKCFIPSIHQYKSYAYVGAREPWLDSEARRKNLGEKLDRWRKERGSKHDYISSEVGLMSSSCRHASATFLGHSSIELTHPSSISLRSTQGDRPHSHSLIPREFINTFSTLCPRRLHWNHGSCSFYTPWTRQHRVLGSIVSRSSHSDFISD